MAFILERLCKASAEAKFTWIMPSRRQTSVENERFLPTNFTNFRARECRAELVRAMPSATENVKKFTRNILNYINGDLVGRTNLTNFRASERRAEFIRAMPSAAENLKANTLN